MHFQSFTSLSPKLEGRDQSVGYYVRSDAEPNAGFLLPTLCPDKNFLLQSKRTESKTWAPNQLL